LGNRCQYRGTDLPPYVEAGITFDNVPKALNRKVPSNVDAVDAPRQGYGISEFIHSLHVPTKAYPHSCADFMTLALMKPPGGCRVADLFAGHIFKPAFAFHKLREELLLGQER
jgi:hypothetical protein